jgi:O-antigen/teichoic acid export membrane protein
MKNVRNVAILAAIAAAIVAIPAASDTAALFTAVLSLVIAALIAYIVARLYRDRRADIYGLGDENRALLYLAIGAAVVLFAGVQIFASALGTLVGTVVLLLCAGAFFRAYRIWRSY